MAPDYPAGTGKQIFSRVRSPYHWTTSPFRTPSVTTRIMRCRNIRTSLFHIPRPATLTVSGKTTTFSEDFTPSASMAGTVLFLRTTSSTRRIAPALVITIIWSSLKGPEALLATILSRTIATTTAQGLKQVARREALDESRITKLVRNQTVIATWAVH